MYVWMRPQTEQGEQDIKRTGEEKDRAVATPCMKSAVCACAAEFYIHTS